MRRVLVALAALSWLALAGCRSPEAGRKRGGGPGADIGNHGSPVVLHGRPDIFHGTPHKIAVK